MPMPDRRFWMPAHKKQRPRRGTAMFLGQVLSVLLSTATGYSQEPNAAIVAAEKARIQTIERISQPTIAIFSSSGNGGGSGVIISADGYALTNFHVVAPSGAAMKVGLSDGRYVDAVLVGLDPGGDVALIKLLGKKDDFPVAQMGDSDTCRVGQWVYVVGNPFLLAEDFQPTVTYGILSGVRRYQFPAGTLLEYADCLQTDAAINPGNSGGPLFDAAGKLIGINGRGSFEKRGRVNVGVGYAISVNQIKRFVGLLKSGRIVDHGSLGATVANDVDGRVFVDDILETSDAYRRGLRYGDELVEFAGREIGSANAFKNALGTFPAGWRVPIKYRRDGKEYQTEVRLGGVHREGELEAILRGGGEAPDPKRPTPEQPKPRSEPGKPIIPKPDAPGPGEPRLPNGPPRGAAKSKRKPPIPKAVRQYYEAAPGYANYWFNRYHQQRIWNAYLAHGDFAETGWNWKIVAEGADGKGSIVIDLTEKSGSIVMPEGQSGVEFGTSLVDAMAPPRSGGLLAALHLWQRLLLVGPRKFGEVVYLGQLPFKRDGTLADCLQATHSGVEMRFYFDPENSNLVGLELYRSDEEDPCEVTFDDIRTVQGRGLPHRWTIRLGDEVFADMNVKLFEISNANGQASDDKSKTTP
ncbi:MAG: trypsin-like peptidase domain-containing protein [Pirellulales bacterium]|nr:trypsin-like peptidase domain-containing protein [Pirellulales bacterium]